MLAVLELFYSIGNSLFSAFMGFDILFQRNGAVFGGIVSLFLFTVLINVIALPILAFWGQLKAPRISVQKINKIDQKTGEVYKTYKLK